MAMFDLIDRIMNLDIGNRGVTQLYEPARARSQEQISEAAGQLADSCSSCHRIYRRAENHCSLSVPSFL